MKKLTCNFSIIGLLIAAFLLSNDLAATEFAKEIVRTFEVQKTTAFELNNLRGDVRIATWDKNSVKIEAKIIVNTKTQAEAEAFLKRIKIDFEKTATNLTVTTVKQEEERSWTDWLTGANKELSWRVHYKVTMPKTNPLTVNNKFGNLYAAGIVADANLSLKYGDARLSNFNNLKFELAYGNGTVSNVKDLDMDIRYGELSVKQTKNIRMNSKYSEVKIDETGELRSLSKYDDFEIGVVEEMKSSGKYDEFTIDEVGTIDAVGRYSDYRIKSLKHAGDFDMKYGALVIEDLANAAQHLKLLGEHTDFTINSDGTFNLTVESQNTDVLTNEKLKNSVKEGVSTFQGKVGSGSSNSLIEARMKFGTLKINRP
jgi:hypothetical protein